MANRDQSVLEQRVMEKQDHLDPHVHYQHNERARTGSVSVDGFNRRHSQISTAKRGSFSRKSFDNANLAMVFPDVTHAEVQDDTDDGDIEKQKVGWFVWLVAFTASIAGSLFGYDTGIISAVLVYLGDDLNKRPTSPNEKELITSLCSGGAFIGAIMAGLTADKVWSTF